MQERKNTITNDNSSPQSALKDGGLQANEHAMRNVAATLYAFPLLPKCRICSNVVQGEHARPSGPLFRGDSNPTMALSSATAVPSSPGSLTLHKFRALPLTGLILTTSERASNLAKNVVWFTRKAWINAEDRLLKNDFHTQLLMVVYAAYTSCLSVVLLKYEPCPADKDFIDSGLAVLSIVLLALSLYLNTKSFKDRAARFKSGYHNLQNIEDRLLTLAEREGGDNEEEFMSLKESYNNTLRDVENHVELDDIRSRVLAGTGLTSRLLTCRDYLHYYFWCTWRLFGLAIAYSAPAAAVIWYALK